MRASRSSDRLLFTQVMKEKAKYKHHMGVVEVCPPPRSLPLCINHSASIELQRSAPSPKRGEIGDKLPSLT